MVPKKVALVTDSLAEPGGASRLLKSLRKLYPEAEVYTSVFSPERFPWLDPSRVHTTAIQKLPCHGWWKRHYSLFSPIGFEQFSFAGFDLVISLSAGCAKGVITTADTFHLGIILTPPRGLWGGERRSGVPLLGRSIDSYQRMWDLEAGLRPDVLVSISRYIQRQVAQVYRRESKVIYPGIDLSFWNGGEETERKRREDFYLVVSRLYEYKRIDLAIQSCLGLGRKLVIVGEGPERHRLERLTRAYTSMVRFEGMLPDEDVRDLMRKCKGFIFPGIEDFGLAPLEAIACGAPVIAFRGGGFCEVLKEGVTGVFFDSQTVDCVIAAVKRFEKMTFDENEMCKETEKFAESYSIDQLKEVIDGAKS